MSCRAMLFESVSEPAAIDCTTAGRSGGNTARISPSLKLASDASAATTKRSCQGAEVKQTERS